MPDLVVVLEQARYYGARVGVETADQILILEAEDMRALTLATAEATDIPLMGKHFGRFSRLSQPSFTQTSAKGIKMTDNHEEERYQGDPERKFQHEEILPNLLKLLLN
jgi:hypothetical protein